LSGPDGTGEDVQFAREASAFSGLGRVAAWGRAGGETFDLVIIGGGITGVGIAHDAAGRGLRVALVEAGDFAQETSSRSSRLVHGGLRYLETFHFGLVFEALAERSRLLRLAPHLVRPLPFLYPIYPGEGVGRLKLTAGMLAYDSLALFHNIRRHRMMGAEEALRREPGLRAQGLRGAALYYDAQVDDARLTLAVARAAHRAGATLLSYARAVGFETGSQGGVEAVRVEDTLSGARTSVRARLVVGAVGPWTDDLRRLADPDAPPRLRPTKGVHIQLPRERVGNRCGITFRSRLDGRVMFVLPWGDFSYVGTTDTDYPGQTSDARAEPADVDYLLESLNHIFPDAAASRGDVVSTWTGIRPLVAPAGRRRSLTASQTSREHEIWREQSGLLLVAGGKLTTFRPMAADVVRTAAAILRKEHRRDSRPFDTASHPLPGAPRGDWEDFVQQAAATLRATGFGSEQAERLADRYGEDALRIAQLVREEPELAEPILPPHSPTWAEVVHAVRYEMALTLEDVLKRRLHLFYDARDGAVSVAAEVARRMAALPERGWSEEEIAGQVQAYTREAARVRDALPNSATP
jgi:glycerol-3-phosphate dehydrogenase